MDFGLAIAFTAWFASQMNGFTLSATKPYGLTPINHQNTEMSVMPVAATSPTADTQEAPLLWHRPLDAVRKTRRGKAR